MYVSDGVIDLLAQAKSKSAYQGKKYFFEGDLNQKSIAKRIAEELGVITEVEGGLPFVTTEEDYELVTKELVGRRSEGWHHYVTHDEYCDIKGEYYFGGEYLRRSEEIQTIAAERSIFLNRTSNGVLYVNSRDVFNEVISCLKPIEKTIGAKVN